jgi:RsiW-degrading membrane proteinase PrsW (M82 family)
VTTGNEACLESFDFVDYMLDEGKTDIFLLLLEDVKNFATFERVAAKVVVVRSLGSMFAHTIFAGIFGYYYGKAKFVGLPTPKDERQLFKVHFHRALRVRYHRYKQLLVGQNIHVHKNFRNKLHEDELIAEGLLIAASLHAIYDFLLAFEKGYWIIPLIFIEYSIIVHEMHIHRNVEVHHFQAR